MRPDIEDFEELNTAEDAPRSRAMSWLVLAVAVGGFGALAYYAYNSGTQSMQDGNVLIVEADETPIKQEPADPEGEQFANQDKTIYDVIAPNASESKVENLLPEPEKPVAVPQAVVAPAPTTFVNKNLTASSSVPSEATPVTPAPAPVAAAPVATKPAPLVVPVPSAVVSTPAVKKLEVATPVAEVKKPEMKKTDSVAAAIKPAVTKVETKTAAAVEKVQTAAVSAPVAAEPAAEEGDSDTGPNFVNESSVVESKPVAEKKETPAPAEKAEKKTASGASQIQLGAFKSEEEAQASWKKISGKFAGVLSGGPTVVKAELPNGTFYRLRTSVSDAKAACAKLSAKGQACFPVK